MRTFIPGCHFTHDPRDDAYAVDRQLTFGAADPTRRSANWRVGPIMDQGMTQQCLAYGFKGLLAAEPFSFDAGQPGLLYQEMCRIDGRVHSPQDTGSTLHAALQVCQWCGLFGSYLWCRTALEVWQFLTDPVHGGPVGLACPWFQDMQYLRGDNTLAVPARLVPANVLGGHFTYLCACKNDPGAERKLQFRGVNSYGTAWGQAGRFWLDYHDLNALLDFGAMVVAPTKAVFNPK